MIYGGTERRSGRASKPIVVAEAPSAVAIVARGDRGRFRNSPCGGSKKIILENTLALSKFKIFSLNMVFFHPPILWQKII